jgi:transcriptional regulator with XRE-family HTH domain
MHPLKKARLTRGLSLAQLAKESGCSAPTIHAAEQGKAVSELTAFKLANALGAEGEDFVRMLSGEQPSGAPEHEKQPA